MINPSFAPNGVEIEYNNAKIIADVAVEKGAEYIIFSTALSIRDAWNNSPKTQLALLDASRDTGKSIGAILAEPERYEGKTLHAAAAAYSFEDIAAILSKATGKTIVNKQIPLVECNDALALSIKDELLLSSYVDVFNFMEEFGCFGQHDSEMIS